MKNKLVIPVAAVLILLAGLVVYKFIPTPPNEEVIPKEESNTTDNGMANYLHSPEAQAFLKESAQKYYGCLVNNGNLPCAYALESKSFKESLPLEQYGNNPQTISSFKITKVETNGTSGMVIGTISFYAGNSQTKTENLSEVWVYQDNGWYHGSE